MESASTEEKLRFGNSTLPPRKNTVEGGGAGKVVHVTAATMHQSVKLPKYCLYSHITWMVSATVAANGMKAKTANLHLLQEPQAATFSSNSTSLFQRQGHDTIKLAFSRFCFEITSDSLFVRASSLRNHKAYTALLKGEINDFYCRADTDLRRNGEHL